MDTPDELHGICNRCLPLTKGPKSWATMEEFNVDETPEQLVRSDCKICQFLGAFISEHHKMMHAAHPQRPQLQVRFAGRRWRISFDYWTPDSNHYYSVLELEERKFTDPQKIPPLGGYVDYQKIKSWIRDCKDHDPYDLNSSERPKCLKIIHCTDEPCVIDAPVPCSYVALSYVWGDSIEAAFKVGMELGKSVPQTIKDSIKVTRELGYEYLWVDRYISQMGLVYGNAVVTLFAVTGNDPSHGLAGVENKRRLPGIEMVVGNVCLKYTSNSLEEIDHSKWATRGWTLQETYLSKRRLFFTEWQVVFVCNQEGFFEHNLVSGLEDRAEGVFGPGSNANPSMSEAPGALIRLYSKRSLRNDEDAYNAISAMLNAITGPGNDYAHIWSVPFIRPDRPHRRLELLWISYAEGVRRKKFPSWSPLGWTSPIEIPKRSSAYDHPEGIVECRTQQGWTIWNELTTPQIEDLRVNPPDQSRLLRVTGMTFDLFLEWRLPSTTSRGESHQLYCSGIDNILLEPRWDCSPEQLMLGDSVTCVVLEGSSENILLLQPLKTRPRCVTLPESCDLVTYERVGVINSWERCRMFVLDEHEMRVLTGPYYGWDYDHEIRLIRESIQDEFTRLFVDGFSSLPKSDKIKGEKQTFLLA